MKKIPARAPQHALKPGKLGKVARTLGLVFLALVLTGTATVGTLYYKLQSNVKQHQIMVAPNAQHKKHQPPIDQKAGQPINILLLGSDARTPKEELQQNVSGMRADTTMLVHISADRTRVDVVSIPRDTLVDIPSCALPDGNTTWAQSNAMFNSAFTLGGSTGDVGAAASCTLATVEELTGLTIDGFMVVNFESFKAVVNSIGGVEMCFAKDIADPEAQLQITAGCHNLDGSQALGIARARRSIGDGSDISRIGRQQELVFQIAKKLFSLNIFSNTQTFYQVASDVTANLDTSEGLGNLTTLAGLAYSMRNINTETGLTFVTMPFYTDPSDPNRVRPAESATLVWEALANDVSIPADALLPPVEQNEVIVGNHRPNDSNNDEINEEDPAFSNGGDSTDSGESEYSGATRINNSSSLNPDTPLSSNNTGPTMVEYD